MTHRFFCVFQVPRRDFTSERFPFPPASETRPQLSPKAGFQVGSSKAFQVLISKASRYPKWSRRQNGPVWDGEREKVEGEKIEEERGKESVHRWL